MQWWVVQWIDANGNLKTQIVSGPKPATPSTGKVFGPYKSMADAQNSGSSNAGAIGTGLGVGLNVGAGIASGGAVGAIPSFPNPLGDLGNFFHALTQGSTWVRVGEVLTGGILVIVAARALAHGSPVAGSTARKSATAPVKKTVKRVATVAAPEARLAVRVASKKAAPKTTARVAAHRAQVKKYGAKKPYQPPAPRPPAKVQHTTTRHVYHHSSKAAKPIRKHVGIPGKKVSP